MLGIIYCIREISSDEVLYVGSTNDFDNRRREHKYRAFHTDCSSPIYKYIREKCSPDDFYENFKLEQLYSGEFNSLEERRAMERSFMEKLNPSLNKNKAKDTPEERAEYRKNWNRANKDKLEANRKRWLEKKASRNAKINSQRDFIG